MDEEVLVNITEMHCENLKMAFFIFVITRLDGNNTSASVSAYFERGMSGNRHYYYEVAYYLA
ncbi:hypothetical protein [Saccharococcus sp. Marseille-Q5394]|uniref:hypothetical protein n=1 Tax=Saccharococcus sp. Marseille-Q5394 TaxID=2972778 RepID=UPI0021C9128D|nr:hypothetical protein [Saccharococcus sp. Marseille-Q5394]